VKYPERYVTRDGDFFLEIHNWGDEAIQLDNLGIILVVRQKDGTRATFGLGEN
jgi:ABC-type phosphate transport system substrate-binding protein